MTEQLRPDGNGETPEGFEESQERIITDLKNSGLSQDDILEGLDYLADLVGIEGIEVNDPLRDARRHLSEDEHKKINDIRSKIRSGAAMDESEEKQKVIEKSIRELWLIGVPDYAFDSRMIRRINAELRKQGNEGFRTVAELNKDRKKMEQREFDKDSIQDFLDRLENQEGD